MGEFACLRKSVVSRRKLESGDYFEQGFQIQHRCLYPHSGFVGVAHLCETRKPYDKHRVCRPVSESRSSAYDGGHRRNCICYDPRRFGHSLPVWTRACPCTLTHIRVGAALHIHTHMCGLIPSAYNRHRHSLKRPKKHVRRARRGKVGLLARQSDWGSRHGGQIRKTRREVVTYGLRTAASIL